MFEITYSLIDSLGFNDTTLQGWGDLQVLLRVLKESPNSPVTYAQILEAKLAEQQGTDDRLRSRSQYAYPLYSKS